MLIVILTMSLCILGQSQQAYLIGNQHNNQFNEVKFINGKLYAVGNITDNQGNRFGTLAEIDQITGMINWITQLDIPSNLLDFIPVGNDYFIAVGRTEPIQNTSGAWQDNQSLVSKFDATGNLLLTRVYDINALQNQTGGRESFHKILINPEPLQADFPFYIAGAADAPGTVPNAVDDLIITSININLDQLFTTRTSVALGNVAIDDKLSRVFKAVGAGNMVLMGNVMTGGITQAVAFYIQNTGTVIAGSERRYTPDIEVIRDAIVLPNRDYVVVGQRGISGANGPGNFIMRMQADLQTIVWAAEIPEHQRFVKIIQHLEDYYVIMEDHTTGNLRYLVNRIGDNGVFPSLVWTKTFDDNDTNFSNPFILSAGNQLVYGDSRQPDATAFITAGYGSTRHCYDSDQPPI